VSLGRLVRCRERDRIAEQFEQSVKAYSEAVNCLRPLRGYQFKQHKQMVEEARTACKTVHKRLQDHEHEHGCSHALILESRSQHASAYDSSANRMINHRTTLYRPSYLRE
jgi:uncharacterized protein YllA (UPF0747 family)